MTTAERKVRQRYPDAECVDCMHAPEWARAHQRIRIPGNVTLGSGATASDAWEHAASRLPNDLEPTS